MMKVRFGWVAFCALVATFGCRAPSPNWNGTWRLNPSKGNFGGTVISISISPDGEYRYDDGSVTDTFRCDGHYQPMGNSRSQACVRSSATTLDKTRMENGVKTNTYHWELSADGKVFTATATALRSGGPVVTGQLAALRISGSKGFAGQWRDVSFLQRHADLTLRLDGQYLHIGYPGAGQYINEPLNGADAPMYGPHAPGMTYAVRRTGQRNGQVFSQGSLELSDDGRAITESWWKPDKPANKSTLYYEKK